MLYTRAQLKVNQIIFIHGGAGGVGIRTIQLAKAMGAIVYKAARTIYHRILKTFGADYTIDYKNENYIDAIFEKAAEATLVASNVQKGEKVLIHAAAGGVGHIAVQISKYLGAEVTGTSSAKNKDFIMRLAADKHIDYNGYNWARHPREFDFVLDTIGGENSDHSLKVTKKEEALLVFLVR